MASFTVCTYNVHGCVDGKGRDSQERILDVLTHLQPDLLCLQEIWQNDIELMASKLGYKVITDIYG